MKSVVTSLFLICGLLLSGCSREESRWTDARGANTLSSVEQFLKDYPHSRFASDAEQLIEELQWQKVVSDHQLSAFLRFQKAYPNSRHSQKAQDYIAVCEFDSLVATRDVNQLRDWKHRQMNSLISGRVDSLINALLRPPPQEHITVEAGVSEADFAAGRLLVAASGDGGQYDRLPDGVTLVVSVKRGTTTRTIHLRSGMTRDSIANLAIDHDIYINKDNWAIVDYVELVFKNNRLVGIR